MARKVKLKVIPVDGPTLKSDSENEWRRGELFKVVWCDRPVFQNNQRITEQDVRDQEYYYDLLFDVNHQYLTVREYMEQQAEYSHGFEEAAKAVGIDTEKKLKLFG